jgi:hypothetical protein
MLSCITMWVLTQILEAWSIRSTRNITMPASWPFDKWSLLIALIGESVKRVDVAIMGCSGAMRAQKRLVISRHPHEVQI